MGEHLRTSIASIRVIVGFCFICANVLCITRNVNYKESHKENQKDAQGHLKFRHSYAEHAKLSPTLCLCTNFFGAAPLRRWGH